jgi:hypothetical protein
MGVQGFPPFFPSLVNAVLFLWCWDRAATHQQGVHNIIFGALRGRIGQGRTGLGNCLLGGRDPYERHLVMTLGRGCFTVFT